jgi:proline iminopeptidase
MGLVLLVLAGLAVAYFMVQPTREIPATTAMDSTLPRIVVDGYPYHGEIFGPEDGPVVVMLHGGPGGDYRAIRPLRVLADDGYRVVFYDQRANGLSPREVPTEALTLQGSVADLHRVIETVAGDDRVALIGHSWGGMIGAYYLDAHPERVAAAVLMEPGVLTSQELQDFIAALTPAFNLATLKRVVGAWLEARHIKGPDEDAGADYFLERLMMAPGPDNAMNAYWCDGVPPPGSDHWRSGARANQGVISAAERPDGTLAMPPLDHLHDYPGEVLLLSGECNTLIGPERQREHLPLFGHARLVVIPDAGHYMHLDQPDTTLAVIRAYLADADWE